ncbi:hypothetical protein [Pontiella desulfatans]|uniref:hypothetical protein n=1 Tax=Pontiella desulfatans TaxID=2750659 RepID=UPI00109C68DD|nr:hypothetical protein [Pontiella desulfatans]
MYTWDGEANTAVFADQMNWVPGGSAFAAADEFQLDGGAYAIIGSNLSVAAFNVDGGSVLQVDRGSTLTINQNNATDLKSGRLNVYGTLDFGGNRWDTSGVGGQVIVNVEGELTGSGNFYGGQQVNTEINVTGLFRHKLSGFGATVAGSSPRVQRMRVLDGGTYRAVGAIVLRSHTNNTAAIELCGGTMVVEAGVSYTYTDLVMNGDDGIIFKSPGSTLVLEGDRQVDVALWIADGALSSEVGAMGVHYDSDADETAVSVPPEVESFHLPDGFTVERGAVLMTESTDTVTMDGGLVTIDGRLIGSGNFDSGTQQGLRLEVNGLLEHQLTGFGATAGSLEPVRQVLRINGGGTYVATGGITLRGHTLNETAIHLGGGLMQIKSGVAYDYSALPLDGNDGIIFKSSLSRLELEGDRSSDVATWIADGALSSECGMLQVSYSSGLTVVETDGWNGFHYLGSREPFWRVSASVAPNSADGWRLTVIPDYLTDLSLSLPFEKRPYAEEVPGVDEIIFVRVLGGLQDGDGNPMYDEDFVVRTNGTLVCRPDRITARLQPYIDQGYANMMIVLDNVNWCLPTVPDGGSYGQRAPEASFDEWYVVVQAACVHLRNLLGEEAANRLRFRVGTESDWPQRWSGTEAQFFDHYDYTAAAVKSVLPGAQVGAYNELGAAKFSGTFGNVNYDVLAQHCRDEVNAKTGKTGTAFDWASASFYFVQDAQDPDIMAANLNRFYQASEEYHPDLIREVHEYGTTADETGLSSYESGARGAVMHFNALLNFTVMNVEKSGTWWRGELEKFKDEQHKLMAGQLWSMHMLKQVFDNGEVALLEETGGSAVGTVRKAVASRSPDGSRLLLGVSAFNTNRAEQTAETVRITLPKSFCTLAETPDAQWIKYNRSTAIYDIVRDDYDEEGFLYAAYDLPHKPVGQLYQMAGVPGKNYIYDNWTSGKSYKTLAEANFNLTAAPEVTVTNAGSDEYTIEFSMEPDTVVILELVGEQDAYAFWAAGWNGDIGSWTNDYDGDGEINFSEYALGGIPVDFECRGIVPEFAYEGSQFQYVHVQRTNDPALSYRLEATGDLTSTNWIQLLPSSIETGSMDGAFVSVTNSIPAGEDEQFIRLRIDR